MATNEFSNTSKAYSFPRSFDRNFGNIFEYKCWHDWKLVPFNLQESGFFNNYFSAPVKNAPFRGSVF